MLGSCSFPIRYRNRVSTGEGFQCFRATLMLPSLTGDKNALFLYFLSFFFFFFCILVTTGELSGTNFISGSSNTGSLTRNTSYFNVRCHDFFKASLIKYLLPVF